MGRSIPKTVVGALIISALIVSAHATIVQTTATATNPPALPSLPPNRTSTVLSLDPAHRSYLSGRSWRSGCPVALSDLRLVVVTYVGFDDGVHAGRLVVHRSVAEGVAQVFDELLANRFPIERIELVDAFDADDDRSTKANNTSAFNCRRASGSKRWSQHAYGKAVDVNPVQNPYVYRDGHVLDPAAVSFLDRSDVRAGMATRTSAVVRAFSEIGWGWGGSFTSPDYQHFSSNGR